MMILFIPTLTLRLARRVASAGANTTIRPHIIQSLFKVSFTCAMSLAEDRRITLYSITFHVTIRMSKKHLQQQGEGGMYTP
jgi:hypothetical protein